MHFARIVQEAMGIPNLVHGREGMVGERPATEIGVHAIRGRGQRRRAHDPLQRARRDAGTRPQGVQPRQLRPRGPAGGQVPRQPAGRAVHDGRRPRAADGMLSNARVVLVRPHFAGNLGAVARVDVQLRTESTHPGRAVRRPAGRGSPPPRDPRRTLAGIGRVARRRSMTPSPIAATSSPLRRTSKGCTATQHHGRPDEVLPAPAAGPRRRPVCPGLRTGAARVEQRRGRPLSRPDSHPDGERMPVAQPGPGRRDLPVRTPQAVAR